MSPPAPEQNELSRRVWRSRYRYDPVDGAPDRSLAETWDRVAAALASVEPSRHEHWQKAFRAALDGFKFLPGGRILAGAGTAATVTLANCFVTGVIDDSVDGVFGRLKDSALTMQWGGGVGCDFSSLAPRGTEAAGPLAYMRIWDATCDALTTTGARRGAMMATLRCDHPDIEAFIDAKRAGTALHNFNLSVLVTDELMTAVREGREWPLLFPSGSSSFVKYWPGFGRVGCSVARLVPARALWERLAAAAYEAAEPGVLFIDRINRANNLYYREQITSTNPCGEVPLPAHGSCILGSMNLTAFVCAAFTPEAWIDFEALAAVVPTAVRMLDDAIDLSLYPLPEQSAEARATRRIGLGVTGLADALIMLGLRYDEPAGVDMARRLVLCVRDAAYRASTALAADKGSFPCFERDAYLAGEYVRSLPDEIRDGIARQGIRNSHLLAIAPAGTISLLANNVSSGVEPVFALKGERRVRDERGEVVECAVHDYAFATWGERGEVSLPRAFVTAAELAPETHLTMLGALQPLIDNAIAKTINVPATLPHDVHARLFERAYELGAKGCTVFRPNAVTGAVLTSACMPGCVN